MATRNQGNYGSYRGNPYAGKGMGVTQSPYVQPFVDYSRDMGKQMMGWWAVHQAELTKIEEKVETRKADFLKAMDNATSIYLKDGLHGHQKDGSTIQVPKLDGEGNKIMGEDGKPIMEDKVLRGETGDMQALVEEYRQNWLASRGITKNKRGKLTGWASGSETTGGSLEARAEAEKIKGTMEDFAADKSLYKEEQAALYNDLGELRVIGKQNEPKDYGEYAKFLHPDNKTEFVRGRGMVIYADDGTDISMKELSKLKPRLENKQLQTDINEKIVKDLVKGDISQFVTYTTDPTTGVTTSTTNKQMLGMLTDTMFNNFSYDDYTDLIMNHSFPSADGSTSVNFFNSPAGQAMQVIYEAAVNRDLKQGEGSLNHELLKDRKEGSQIKKYFFNDPNFVLDKEALKDGSATRAFVEKQLEDSGMDAAEVDKALNFLSSFNTPDALQGRNMPMNVYVQEKVEEYYRDISESIVNNRLSAPKPVDKDLLKLAENKRQFDEEMKFKRDKLEKDNAGKEVLSYFDYMTSNVKRGLKLEVEGIQGSFDEVSISDFEQNIQGMNTKGAGIDIEVKRNDANNKIITDNKASIDLTKAGQSDQLVDDLSDALLPGDNVIITISNPETIKQITPARKTINGVLETEEAYNKRVEEAGMTVSAKDIEISVPYTGKYIDLMSSMATTLKGTGLQFDPSEIRANRIP